MKLVSSPISESFKAFVLQLRIVLALQERELLVRSEKGLLGAFGILVEPLLVLATLLILKILVRLKTADLINPVVWMASGVSIYYLFTSVALKAVDGVRKSQDVFFYRRIRPLDTLLATAMVESRTYASVLVLIITGVWFYTWNIQLDSPGEATVVFLLAILLALGCGVSILVIGRLVPLVKLLFKFGIRRILLWTSGVFFALYTLPGPVRPYLTWNPVLHAVELFRHAINKAYPIPGISLLYLAACTVFTCGFGLIFYSANENLLLSDES